MPLLLAIRRFISRLTRLLKRTLSRLVLRFVGVQPNYPCIGFLPALPLRKNIELGDWVVGDPPDGTPWRSARFKELVDKLLDSFARNDSGERFEGGARLWRKNSGFDGRRPSDDEIRAIEAAIRFAVLDCNDQVSKDDPNGAHRIVSSENAALHIQPIDEEHGYITHLQPGFVKKILGGGWKIGDKPPPLADATFAIMGQVPASSKLANAVFQAHVAPTTNTLRRLTIAVEWHSVALANPVAVTLQQRLIALKTGFEALLGTSNSRKGARLLRTLFETTAKPHYNLLPSPNVLWSPTERTDLQRQWDNKPDVRSELEDWFLALANARNTIIHEGRVPDLEYPAPKERPLSRYAGHLYWTGERVLREAIKATLGTDILLCGPLKEQARRQRLIDMLDQIQSAAGVNPPPPVNPPVERAPSSANARPDRDLGQLLQALGCQAANQVLIGRSLPQAYRSVEAEGDVVAGSWVAKCGGKEVGISDAELVVLEQAGAECELPEHITLCD